MVAASTNHYCDEFVIKCTPFFVQGFDAIYNNTMEKCKKKRFLLRQFQETLESIPLWNSRIIATEHQRFVDTSNCMWLDDLIKAAFLELANNIVDDHKIDIDVSLEIPNGIDFIHSCYINIARDLWKKPQLFYHGFEASIKMRNREEFEKLVERCLLDTFKKQLPMERILSTYLNDNNKGGGAGDETVPNAEEESKTVEEDAPSEDKIVSATSDNEAAEFVQGEEEVGEEEHEQPSEGNNPHASESSQTVSITLESQSDDDPSSEGANVDDVEGDTVGSPEAPPDELKQIDTTDFPKMFRNDRSETSIVKLDTTDESAALKEETDDQLQEAPVSLEQDRIDAASDVSSEEALKIDSNDDTNEHEATNDTQPPPLFIEHKDSEPSEVSQSGGTSFFDKIFARSEPRMTVFETAPESTVETQETNGAIFDQKSDSPVPEALESEDLVESDEKLDGMPEEGSHEPDDQPLINLKLGDLALEHTDPAPDPSAASDTEDADEKDDFDVQISSNDDAIVLSKVSRRRSNQDKLNNILGPGITVKDFKNPKTRNRIKKYLLLKNTLY